VIMAASSTSTPTPTRGPFLGYPSKEQFAGNGYPPGYEDTLTFFDGKIKSILEQAGATASNPGTTIWNEEYQCFEYQLKIDKKEAEKEKEDKKAKEETEKEDKKAKEETEKEDKKAKEEIAKIDYSPGIEGKAIRILFKKPNIEPDDSYNIYLKRSNSLIETSRYLIQQKLKNVSKDVSEEVKEKTEELMTYLTYLNKKENFKNKTLAPEEIKKMLKYQYGKISNLMKALDKEFKELKGISKEWKKESKKIEAQRIAEQQNRDILISVFPCPKKRKGTDSKRASEKLQLQYECCVPLTNVPSPLRDGTGNCVPNCFNVTKGVFSLDTPAKVLKETSQLRSSSFPAIAIFRNSKREEKTRKIAENHIKLLAKNQVIDYILKNKDKLNTLDIAALTKAASVKLAVTTLLSPIAKRPDRYFYDTFIAPRSKTPGQVFLNILNPLKWIQFVINIFGWIAVFIDTTRKGEKNDAHQIEETQAAFESIKDLKFSKEEADAIIEVLAKNLRKSGKREDEIQKITKDLRWKINNTNITKRTIHLNFASNVTRGYDFSGVESRINNEAKIELAKAASEQLNSIINSFRGNIRSDTLKDDTVKILTNLKETMDTIANNHMTEKGISLDPRDKNWQFEKRIFLHNIGKLYDQINKLKEPGNLGPDNPIVSDLKKQYRTLCLFYQHMEYTFDPNYIKGIVHDPLHNFTPAVIANALAFELGFTPQVTCKSGEDRTGGEQIMDNQILAKIHQGDGLSVEINGRQKPLHKILGRSESYNHLLKEIWDDFPQAAMASNSRDITDLNAPGAQGLQIEGGNVPNTDKLQTFIKKELAHAKLHKKAHKSSDEVTDLIQEINANYATDRPKLLEDLRERLLDATSLVVPAPIPDLTTSAPQKTRVIIPSYQLFVEPEPHEDFTDDTAPDPQKKDQTNQPR